MFGASRGRRRCEKRTLLYQGSFAARTWALIDSRAQTTTHVSLDLLFKRAFGDQQSTELGSGWASGVLAVLAGSLALGGVLCFQFPEWLTTPAFRTHYSMPDGYWAQLAAPFRR